VQIADVPQAQVHAFDGLFRWLGSFSTAARINRSYKHTEPQRANTADVQVALDDPLLRELLHDDDGGYVIGIFSEAYPVPWVGILVDIDANLETEVVTLRAVGWTAVLAARFFGATDSFSGPPASVFQAMLDRLNQINPVGLTTGIVAAENLSYEIQVADKSAASAFTEFASQTGNEWWIDIPEASESGITLTLNLGRSRGQDRSGSTVLYPGGGASLTGWRRNERARLYTATITGGQSALTQAYASRTRAVAATRQKSSRATASTSVDIQELGGLRERHGYLFYPETGGRSPVTRRESLRVFEGLRGVGAVTQAAAAALAARGVGGRAVRVQVDWRGAGGWDSLQVGDVVRLTDPDAFGDGIDAPFAIQAAQPFEAGGFLDLVGLIGD